MDFDELLAIYFALDGRRLTSDGLLMPLSDEPHEKIPHVYLMQRDHQTVMYLRYDLSAHIAQQLRKLQPDQVWGDHETVQRILSQDTSCKENWMGKTYLFPMTLTSRDYPDVVQLDEVYRAAFEQYAPGESLSCWPMYAILVDGKIVSTCQSSQEDMRAAEHGYVHCPIIVGAAMLGR
ncbi:MAG TPA: hypothetical protein VFB12_21195 [Ktedonobacteraceae bacterium]|nr:hypothetical protein [Ktedonobacteraceae bacterium]